MPHQGRSVQELWDAGIREIPVLQHAALDETGTLDFIESLSPEGRQEAIEGGLSGAIGEGDAAIDSLLDCLDSGKSIEECMGGAADGGRAEEVTETGAVSVTGETRRDITGRAVTEMDELIQRISRTYIDIPTPEELLDDFEFSFSGFAANAVEAGMSQADVDQMLDPASGFMQSMLSEYIGELSQRAQRGEDLFEVVGLEGEPTRVGERPGAVTVTETVRMTRTEAEQVLRESGQQVTDQNIQRVIDEDFQRQQSTIATTTETGVTTTTEEVTEERGREEFQETEELWERPRVTPVFRFSPTDFLLQRFAPGGEGTPEEVTERFLGRVATEVRAAAPRRRPVGGAPAISARRA